MEICTSKQQYLNAIIEPVRRCCKRYGYLPSVLIAQSCLENGYGVPAYWDNPQIELLMKYNNMVGIKTELLSKSWNKYTVWQGESLTKNTPEQYGNKMVTIKDSFRKYDTIERSFADFLLFLTYASNYGEGGTPKYGRRVLDIKDPATLIKTVGGLGYATGQTYPTSVMRIVNEHNLTKYDNLDGVTPTIYAPGGVIEGGTEKPITVPTSKNTIKIEPKNIIDIRKENLSQVPASRGNNPIQFIVIHYLGVPNADNPYLYGGGYGGHYNIKRDGSIYWAADPRTAVIWHCGGGLQGTGGHKYYKICTNYNSIGIECGVAAETTKKELPADSDLWYFTKETQESLVYLVSKLMDEFNIDMEHVIRHYDVVGKICPNPYVKNNNFKTSWTWDQFKLNLQQYRKDNSVVIPSGQTPADVTPAPQTNRLLKRGMNGDDVLKMQQILIAIGYSCGKYGADGDFGNATEKALKQFQKDKNLEVDGIYGPKSKSALETTYASKDSGSTPSTGYTVRITANVLNIRSGPGTNFNIVAQIIDKGLYTIVEENNGWGRLKSGIGWISLNYTRKV